MAALTANLARVITDAQLMNDVRHMDMNASETSFEGAVAYIDATTGRLAQTGNAGANRIAGIVARVFDNTATASPTTDTPTIVEFGQSEEMTLTGVVAKDQGKGVYASADNSVLTLTSAGSSVLGYVHKVTATNKCFVRIDPGARV